MIKQYLYPGSTVSYLIGLLGIGFSMSSLPAALRIVIAVISISILVITAGIKMEEYLKKRHNRLMREETRGMKMFLRFLRRKSDTFDDLDEKDIQELDQVHDEFVEEDPLE